MYCVGGHGNILGGYRDMVRGHTNMMEGHFYGLEIIATCWEALCILYEVIVTWWVLETKAIC